MPDQAISPDCGAVTGGTRCADCTNVACALRALGSGQTASPTSPAQCAHRRAVSWSVGLALALARPQIRYRVPTLLVFAVFTASAVAAHGLGARAWIALALAGLLGVWWSAPRATAARWLEWVLLAAATAALAADSKWAATWPVPALALGLAGTGLRPGLGAAAWAVVTLAAALGALTPGASVGVAPLVGLTLSAALGVLISGRRAAGAREHRRLSALFASERSAATSPESESVAGR